MKVFFRKDRLPPARVFYERELGSLSRPNRKGWALGRCPFHKSTSGRSFSVNVDSGGFRCFGCDAHGGDVLSFLRQRDGLSFKDAAQRLGAWDGNDGKPFKIQPGPLERWLVMDFEIDGVKYQAAVKDEPKNKLQLYRRFYAEASARLLEIRNGQAEKFEGEEEIQRGILADTWELIQMEAGENG